MTKSRLRLFLFTLLIGFGGRASALEVFDCVHKLMPVTWRAAFQVKRSGVEAPHMAEGGFLVFPEVHVGRVVGFFVYDRHHAWHYDSIQSVATSGQLTRTFKLQAVSGYQTQIYRMVAQPDGLRTVTIDYLPGYQGPVVRRGTKLAYHNPAESSEDELRNWIYERLERKPAEAKQLRIEHTLVHLVSQEPLTASQLGLPLREELRLRKQWIQSHNLDESSFRELTALMKRVCRED